MESIEAVSRDSFIFYRSFYDAVEALDEEDRLAAFEAIVRYALDGTEERQKGAVNAIMSVIKPLLDVSRQNYINGRKGGRPKKPNRNRIETEPKPNGNRTITEPKPNDNRTETESKPNHNRTVTEPKPNYNLNVNENVNVNDNVGAQEGGHAPDPAEVKAYADSIGYTSLDAQSFCDYYSARGWKINGEPIRDWRALVRRWLQRDEKKQTSADVARKKPNGFHNFDERKEDLSDFEVEVMKKMIENDRRNRNVEGK